jgi:serine/threonine-protein kinase
MDFGLAVLSGQATTGQVAGTPAYMAPEQLAGDLATPQSDLFGLGVVLYELFVGRALFPVRTFEGRLSVGHNARSAGIALQDVDTAVEGIIRSCLSDAPADRPASAQAIADTLTRHDASTTSLRDDTQRRTASLAVLPFANTSRDPEEEYFSDGLAGEIINALAHIPGLQVIARTSSFAFKGKHEDVRQIANTLGVTYVLEGSVHRIGGRLRVTAHLVQAANGAQTWSDRYNREVADVFAVQDEIATAIASALSVSIPRAAEGASRPHEPSLPAYDAYLKGVYHLPTRLVTDPTRIKRAVEFFRQASVLDPDWSPPHASLAYLYFSFWQMGIPSPEPMLGPARVEAEHALALTPSDSTSNAVMGALAASYDYDWDEANRRFRRALTSGSLAPTVHDLYARFYLSPLGQFDAAIEHQQRAIARDPLHLWWRVRLLPLLIYGGRYEQAILESSRVMEFESDSFIVQLSIASARIFQGAVTEARAAAEEACRFLPWSETAKGLLAGILVQAGERERAQALLDSNTTPAFAGRIYYHVLAGENDAALDWYERAAEQRLPVATELASAIFLQSVRSTPRWLGIARRLNLPSAR